MNMYQTVAACDSSIKSKPRKTQKQQPKAVKIKSEVIFDVMYTYAVVGITIAAYVYVSAHIFMHIYHVQFMRYAQHSTWSCVNDERRCTQDHSTELYAITTTIIIIHGCIAYPEYYTQPGIATENYN